MARPELGSKRQCQTCGAKFFDLSRNPIVCPKCGTIFQMVAIAARAPARPAPAEEDTEPPPGNVELVSLEDAETSDDKAVTTEEDIEIDDVTVADETFLEEEEEGSDDVSDLIDGDIEDDEEA